MARLAGLDSTTAIVLSCNHYLLWNSTDGHGHLQLSGSIVFVVPAILDAGFFFDRFTLDLVALDVEYIEQRRHGGRTEQEDDSQQRLQAVE